MVTILSKKITMPNEKLIAPLYQKINNHEIHTCNRKDRHHQKPG